MAVRQFGSTWWGKAWVHALEERAALDPNRLARGRTYARQDRVARVEVMSGVIPNDAQDAGLHLLGHQPGQHRGRR